MFSAGLFQNFQACFSEVVAPDVLPHNPACYFVSWKPPLTSSRVFFLPQSQDRLHLLRSQKVIVDITDITKVSLDQDFKTFSQEFVVGSRRELFFSADKSLTRKQFSCPIEYDVAPKLNEALAATKLSTSFHAFPTGLIIEGKWMAQPQLDECQDLPPWLLVLIKILDQPIWTSACFFKFWTM